MLELLRAGSYILGVTRTMCIAAWMWMASAAYSGQAAGEPQQFEVATVKPSAPPTAGKSDYQEGYIAGARAALADQGLRIRGDRVAVTDNSLRDLIRLAYQLRDHQIDAPVWMAAEKYDIAAKIPAGVERSEVPAMLRNLLEQRFRLRTHREKREMTVSGLQVVGSGAKLTATPEGRRGPTNSRPGRVIAMSASLATFAELLGKAEGRPVVDLTGINGLFDIDLKYTPELSAASSESGPSLVAALREQLGLRLERRKMQVEVLVIDGGERIPAEN